MRLRKDCPDEAGKELGASVDRHDAYDAVGGR